MRARGRYTPFMPAATDYTILVPVKASTCGEGLGVWLTELARHAGTRLVLLHVTPDLSDVEPAQARAVLDDARALLHDCAQRLALPAARINFRLAMGDAASEIVKAGLLSGADMTVMTTHAHSGLERLVEGGTTETVMRRAHSPTFICHAGQHPGLHGSGQAIEKILVPLDGSAQSARIVDTVADLAHLTGARVILHHDDQGYLELEVPETALDTGAQLEEYRARLAADGIAVDIETSQLGKPAEEILNKIDELGVDLVAMTTHGRSSLARVLFGSVTGSILRHGRCPLLTLSTAPTRRLAHRAPKPA